MRLAKVLVFVLSIIIVWAIRIGLIFLAGVILWLAFNFMSGLVVQ